jgi:hypothetical protein
MIWLRAVATVAGCWPRVSGVGAASIIRPAALAERPKPVMTVTVFGDSFAPRVGGAAFPALAGADSGRTDHGKAAH